MARPITERCWIFTQTMLIIGTLIAGLLGHMLTRNCPPIVLTFILILLGFFSLQSHANPWSDAANGNSSFLTLGPDYSVFEYLKLIRGARVVLINKPLAARLGLTARTDAELEKKILEHFAVTTTWMPTSKKGFATKYTHTTKVTNILPCPTGDGRVVWLGELIQKRGTDLNPEYHYTDITVKGTRTAQALRFYIPGTARFFPENCQYGDGLQSMEEAVRGFIVSSALYQSGIGGTEDLAVLEIPTQKYDVLRGHKHRAALTVRVGNILRVGHLFINPFDGSSFSALQDLIVRRFLRLAPNHPITEVHRNEFSRQMSTKIGRLSAVLEDLGFAHGALAAQNFLTSGDLIDFGTFVATNPFLPNYTPLVDSMGSEYSTLSLLLHDQLTRMGITTNAQLIDQSRTETFLERWLMRLGVEQKIIPMVPEIISDGFLAACFNLRNLKTSIKYPYANQNIFKPLFNLNLLLSGTHALLNKKVPVNSPLWDELFEKSLTHNNDAEVNSMKAPQVIEFKQAYVRAVTNLSVFLSSAYSGNNASKELNPVIQYKSRGSRNFPDIAPLVSEIRAGALTANQLTLRAEKIATSLVDWAPNQTNSCSLLLSETSATSEKTNSPIDGNN